jgi:hypothetical protein
MKALRHGWQGIEHSNSTRRPTKKGYLERVWRRVSVYAVFDLWKKFDGEKGGGEVAGTNREGDAEARKRGKRKQS